MTTIVQMPDSVLRATAQPVPLEDIGTPAIKDIISRMKTALAGEDDGVAIAAPQIGVSLRIFVISARASKKLEEDIVFINPTIIRLGKKKEPVSEGCLSVRWQYGTVKRATTATVRAYNAEGNEFVMSGRDLIAQIFQHEIDHLDGVLFVDLATGLQEIPPEVTKK